MREDRYLVKWAGDDSATWETSWAPLSVAERVWNQAGHVYKPTPYDNSLGSNPAYIDRQFKDSYARAWGLLSPQDHIDYVLKKRHKFLAIRQECFIKYSSWILKLEAEAIHRARFWLDLQGMHLRQSMCFLLPFISFAASLSKCVPDVDLSDFRCRTSWSLHEESFRHKRVSDRKIQKERKSKKRRLQQLAQSS